MKEEGIPRKTVDDRIFVVKNVASIPKIINAVRSRADETVEKIKKMHKANQHKLEDMPRFVPMGRSEWI